jgi:predicted LPLAT superfamily acyltransferase
MSDSTSTPVATPWHAREEAGHAWGLLTVEAVARAFGRRVAHWFVAPVAVYFLLNRGAERRASREFLSRALGRPATLVDCARHFYTFARVAVDRVFLLSPQAGRVPKDVGDVRPFEELLKQGRSCMLVGGHLGSFEACRQAGMGDVGTRLHVLLDRAVNARIVQRLERLDPDFARGIIDASADPLAVVLRVGEVLRAGGWIGWLADRHRDNERTITVNFLGTPARWPVSPFVVAHMFKVQVVLVLAFFDRGHYHVIVEPLADDAALACKDREQFVRQQIERFVRRLEEHVRRWPYNWFNFHDFWNT